ncbi:MAG: hypothetical protein D6734_09740, partial [Candidatus Schekmanbacteria bacterium]
MKKNIVPVVLFLIIIPAFFFFSIKLQSSLEKDLVERYGEQKLQIAEQVSRAIEKYFFSLSRNIELMNVLYRNGWVDFSSNDDYLKFVSAYFQKFKSVSYIFAVRGEKIIFKPLIPLNQGMNLDFFKEKIRESLKDYTKNYNKFYVKNNRFIIVLP